MRNTRRILSAIGLLLASMAGGSAFAYNYYSLAPAQPEATSITAHGTGMNNYVEGAICLNPADDPLVARLKGHKVVGVKCYLRQEYNQAAKSQSMITAAVGSLEEEPLKKTANFSEGWNEVMFDSPIEIGDEPIYVGVRVFETKGKPYPLVSYKDAVVKNGFFINLKREKWESMDRGTLLLQAILDGDAADFAGAAFAQVSDCPLIVAPSADFSCSLYVHNQSAEPCREVEVTTRSGDALLQTRTISFDTPIEPFDGRLIRTAIMAPPTEGSAVDLSVEVSAVNGVKTSGSMKNAVTLYVSKDVFSRIPVIEEFTGLFCPNCPFMSYYLDEALEGFGSPYVYITRHAGFVPDRLTTPSDEAITYLFGETTYNPAVMYDRRVLSGQNFPVNGAKEPSAEPYSAALAEVMTYPAQATLDVKMEHDGENVKAIVTGKISEGIRDIKEDLNISAFLVEDGLPLDDYPQSGISDELPDDAPADLVEKFRHNGVIRSVLMYGDNGDPLPVNEDGTFECRFERSGVNKVKDWSKAHVVAFIHKVNESDLSDNFVVNGGDSRLYGAGVNDVAAEDGGMLRVAVADGRIVVLEACSEISVYDVAGRRHPSDSRLTPGLYLVKATLASGRQASAKVIVK